MKASYYNFFYPYENDENKFIAYNSLSNALALVEKNKYEAFMNFYEQNKEIEDQNFIDDLKRGLFLIDDYVNEKDLIRFRMLQSRFSTSSFGLTIAPTSDCNFRCIYCYEKDVIKPSYMSTDVQDKIVELLQNNLKTISNFSVSWYGGEPLLALEVIERLSTRFIALCDEKEVTYGAGIITNGYLLNRETIQLLNKLKINFIQVTIDGTPDVHNRRRPLADGGETFDAIFNNLRENYDILPTVSLRINVDRNNIDSGKYVYDYLKEHGMLGKITPYLGKTSNDNDCYEAVQCLNMCDYAKADYEYTYSMFEDKKGLVKYPYLKSNFCGADSYNAYVIDATGNLYKCWSDIGIVDRSVGNIVEPKNVSNTTFFDYLLFDPTTAKPCSTCNLLPVCMGGCPYKRLNRESDNCSMYKYVLEECIGNATSFLKEEAIQKKEN